MVVFFSLTTSQYGDDDTNAFIYFYLINKLLFICRYFSKIHHADLRQSNLENSLFSFNMNFIFIDSYG